MFSDATPAIALADRPTTKEAAHPRNRLTLPQWHTWQTDLALFGGMFFVLGCLGTLFFGKFPPALSYAPHFVVQAQSWLNGHLDLPASFHRHDVIVINGLHYLVYPPMPALLMLPFVAVLGSSFSDIGFTWAVGAINVVLVFHLLNVLRNKGWSPRTTRENIVLAALFGVGTIALWLAMDGAVWFTSQTVAITFTLTMLMSALTHKWWFASLSVGALLLTRSTDIVGGVLVAVLFLRECGQPLTEGEGEGLWQVLHWQPTHIPRFSQIVAVVLPFLLCVAIYLTRNALLFQSPLSTGYDIQIKQVYPSIHYGLFSWHYVWPNFVANFLNLPAFNFTTPFDPSPAIDIVRGGNGTSLFFTTPLFLLFLLPTATSVPYRWLRATLWTCAGLIIVLALFFNATGWYQVGARYLFDAYPYLWLLLAMRAERIGWRWVLLATAGVLINIALSQAFWCEGIAHCFSLPDERLRKYLYIASMAVAAGAGIATWLWLRADPERQQQDIHAFVVEASPTQKLHAIRP
jgi:hypothetical protein